MSKWFVSRRARQAAWILIAGLGAEGLTFGAGDAKEGATVPPPAPYQWIVKQDRGNDRQGRPRPPAEIGLWIPPSCAYVKGVLLGTQTLLERSFLEDPRIRECAARNNLAIVFPAWPDAALMEKFAEASGYLELKTAPFITIGHSTGGIGARNAAYQAPKRAIAVLHFHSGNYHTGIPGPDLTLAGVPFLAVNGEFEEYAPDCGFKKETGWGLETQWRYGKQQLTDLQKKDPNHLFTMLIEPGAGHFSYLPRTVEYVALYLDKACKARLSPGESHELREVKPEQGWLTDANLKEPKFAAAPYADYRGDRADAFRAFDEEHAAATVAYHKKLGGKEQHVTFGSGGQPLFGNAHRPGVPFVPVPGSEGREFQVEGVFLAKGMKDSVVEGQDLEHAAGPVEFKAIDGPVESLGGGKFRILFRGSMDSGRGAVLMACHPGDGTFRYAEHPGFIGLKLGVQQGKAQTIAFPPVGDLKAGATAKLRATSDSGLPVEYAVACGPAEIVDRDTLRILPIPPRAKRPVEVKVVAWQWGKEGEGGWTAASPVEQIVRAE
jgi:hypothetical protein